MITKYDSWEELKESFSPEILFECEGEMFQRIEVAFPRFNVHGSFIVVYNKHNPDVIIITVVVNGACAQYTYRKVEYV